MRPKDIRMMTWPWWMLQHTAVLQSCLNDASNQDKNARNNAITLQENKSNDGRSNLDIRHSVPVPIAAPTLHGVFPSNSPEKKPNSGWTGLDQELSIALPMRLRGYTAKQISAFCEIVHNICFENSARKLRGRGAKPSSNQTDVKARISLMGSRFQTLSDWVPFAQSRSSTSKAIFFSE